jgi:hypothetical protein
MVGTSVKSILDRNNKFFSSLQPPNRLWILHPAYDSVGTEGSFSGSKVAGEWIWSFTFI